MSLDQRLLLAVNSLVGQQPWLDRGARLMVNDYLVPVLLTLALLFLWLGWRDSQERERWQRSVLAAVLGLAISSMAIVLMNQLYFRPRPFVDLPQAAAAADLIFYLPTDSSFPTNPVAVAFALATGVFLGWRPLGTALYLPACLIALSRVYAGVAYPSDVLGGALLGFLAVWVAFWLLKRLEPLSSWLLVLLRRLYLA